jgi:hypothetical protein
MVAAPAFLASARLGYALPDRFRYRLEKSTLPSSRPIGGQDVVGERCDDLPESGADDHSDRHVDDVPSHGEFLELS